MADQTKPNSQTTVYNQNVTSHNQQGGVTAHTVHIGKPVFELTQEHINEVMQACTPGVPVTVFATGTQRAFPMQAAIAAALQGAGFSVNLDSAATIIPLPETPLSVTPGPPRTIVTIAPNA
jgi:hypothetical protein